MDLRDQLLESSDRKEKGAGKFSIASVVLHGGIVGFILFMSATATHKVNAENKPIRAFLAASAAPPPPPPPPPPPASSAPSAPHFTTPKPVVVQRSFVQPTEVPKQLPKVEPISTQVADVTPSQQPATSDGGQQGGVTGGVTGGVEGGIVGGVVGGQVGGVIGGVVGGTPGGTGTGTGNGDAKPAEPPPPPKEEGPLRVGGDVKAPVVLKRVEPKYSDLARQSKTQGVVVVEAVIDKDGNVDKVKVIKGLPMGLSQAADEAVRQWKFKPGTLNGEPVDVIFDLTVNFTLQ